CIQSLEFPWMF
nr:immunoglobulin light chain junction region [Macaca mulatta]